MMIDLGNVLILGDSYSTFYGHIPSQYHFWYSEADSPYTDVRKVEETWWHRLLRHTRSRLLLNCSFSGTTLCHTGYNGEDCSSVSFAARLDGLIEDGYFKNNRVDTFLIFGGTNDSWAGSPMGEVNYAPKSREELYQVLPAFCHILAQIKAHAPQARTVNILNTELDGCLGEGMAKACLYYGAEQVVLQDIDKSYGHPTVQGMAQIEAQVLAHLQQKQEG